jgi:3-hydroxyacyl-[acyl-carrier-protein] dehydratase
MFNMLKNNLYTIQQISEEKNSIHSIIELNAQHEIFKGHFPRQPVLPGACILQMTKEILETLFEKKLQLTKADDIRFSAMVDPTKNKELKFLIKYNFSETHSINIVAKILKEDEVVCCKIKATYVSSKA